MPNPFAAIAELALGWLRNKILQNWLKLLFELACSGLLSFLMVCGSTLAAACVSAATRAYCWPLSAGSGMIVSAVCMTVVFRRSPLTKGMLLVLPGIEGSQELKTDLQVIERK